MPDLDTQCSRYFTYRQLIECGETWARLAAEGQQITNLPDRADTWRGIESVARSVLDPLHIRFGLVRLTYGFASAALTRRIAGRIAPRLDQHAGSELGMRGRRVCERGGQAVDLEVPGIDSIDVAIWIRDNLDFDRIYIYGATRPLHVSHATTSSGRVFAMVSHDGRRVPHAVAHLDAQGLRGLFASR